MEFHSDECENSAGDLNSAGKKAAVSKSEPVARCSLCSKTFNRSQSKTFPFCSTRCQQIDLGRWLDESYGFPVEGTEELGEIDPHE